jgi:hypothetical protein
MIVGEPLFRLAASGGEGKGDPVALTASAIRKHIHQARRRGDSGTR